MATGSLFHSQNSSATDTHLPISLTYDVWALVIVSGFLAILMLWTVLGNFLVFASLCRFKKLRSTSNFLIGNLAVSDFLLALTVMPMSSVTDVLGYWVFGLVICNVWLSLDVLYCTASIWSLVAIAFDRFTATSFPVWYRDQRNNRRVVTYVVLVWVLSVLICMPPLVGWDGQKIENPFDKFKKAYVFDNATRRHQCVLFTEPHYVIYSAMGSFIIPLIVLIMLYTKIFVVLQHRAGLLRDKRRKSPPRLGNGLRGADHSSTAIEMTQLTSSPPEIQGESSTTNTSEEIAAGHGQNLELESSALLCKSSSTAGVGRPTVEEMLAVHTLQFQEGFTTDDGASSDTGILSKKRIKRKLSQKTKAVRKDRDKSHIAKADRREQRATKRMALIIALFVLCWIPFTMMYMIRSLCGEEFCPDYLHLRMFVIWLGYANSGLNPILYTIFNEDFREAFLKLLGCSYLLNNSRRRCRL